MRSGVACCRAMFSGTAIWPATSLDGTVLADVYFDACRIDAFELTGTTRVSGSKLAHCTIQSVARESGGIRTFDPDLIQKLLTHAGFDFSDGTSPVDTPALENDEEIELVERLLRTLFRATQVSEETLRKRFGTRANRFMEHVLPELLHVRFLDEVVNAGGGQGRRFKLAVPMQIAEEALASSAGGFRRFVAAIQARSDRARGSGIP